nr:disease resistance protein RPV1-like [Ziziphus jujuba var. spinosa]
MNKEKLLKWKFALNKASNLSGWHLDKGGKDTCKNFTGHLNKALRLRGVKTFTDNELNRGEEISSSLIKVIAQSKISIVVFSKNYASYPWCLDELVEILECQDSLGQVVWPVFYDMEPHEVRNLKGSFGKALAKYVEESRNIKNKIKKLPIFLDGL